MLIKLTLRMLGDVSNFRLSELRSDLSELLDRITNCGSGYTLLCITKCIVSTARYNPQAGSRWIATHSQLVNRKEVINVEISDERCFQWDVLSAICLMNKNSERVSN